MADIERLPPGAGYIADFVDEAAEAELAAAIDAAPWIADLRRRVQHYGYRYDYRARTVTRDACLGPLPGWAQALGEALAGAGHFPRVPDKVIVNEYLPGQGISAHVDCVPCFGGTIASLSLLSACEMRFEACGTGERRAAVLAPRSVLLLTGPARFEWTHAIPARKSDTVNGRRVARARRLSLTFRTVELA